MTSSAFPLVVVTSCDSTLAFEWQNLTENEWFYCCKSLPFSELFKLCCECPESKGFGWYLGQDVATKKIPNFQEKSYRFCLYVASFIFVFYPVKSPNLSGWEIEDAAILCGGSAWSWEPCTSYITRVLTELYKPFKTFEHPALDLCLPTKVF